MKITYNDNEIGKALSEARDPSLKPNISRKSGFAAFRTFIEGLAATWVRRKKLYMELMMLDECQLSFLKLGRRDIPKFVKKSFRSTETKYVNKDAEALTHDTERQKAA